ncbi:NAD(P)/FAD-dependent oxidoreductase [Streptomyces sp. NPDC005480]|uniref:FAD-dependent oxidoreductase n=1 Tax=Streptomyces sp. NPDC005480 TaxID=3154880 RepID=UPI00339E6145
MRVIVAGGGVAGLALGHGLVKYGVDVEVLEARSGIEATGYRLHMNADGGNALRFLLTPAAYAAYEQTSRRNPRRHVLAILDENLRERGARAHIGAPNDRLVPHTAVNRLTLRQILASALGERLHHDACVIGYTETADSVTVRLEDGREFTGDVLVAAEGMGSPVRRQRLGEPEFRDTGEAAIYSRVSYAALEGLDLPPVLEDGFILAFDPAGREFTFGPFPPRRPVREVAAELLPGTTLTDVVPYLQVTVSVPAEGPNAFTQGSVWDADQSALHTHIVKAVQEWSPVVRDIVDRIDVTSVSAVPIRGIATTEPWEPSRVTVVGDAIHGMPPNYGAGANTALKDAAYLAEHLLRVADGSDLVEEIGAYEAAMRAYAYPIANAAQNPASRNDATFVPEPSA